MLLLNPLLTNNVVLQAEKPYKISGTTDANSEVLIKAEGTYIQVKSNDEGLFVAELPPQPYGYKGELSVETKVDQQSITVQYGDVFLFAGQSNMDYRMGNEDHLNEEIQTFKEGHLFFKAVPQVDYEDENGCHPKEARWQAWKKLNKETLKEMSAVAYYALKVYQDKFPERIIGAVLCSKGGTSASCWISEEFLTTEADINSDIVIPFRQAIAGKTKTELEEELQSYMNISKAYYLKRATLIQEHPEMSMGDVKKEVGFSPWPPPSNPYLFTRPSGLYHTMFKKIVPFTFTFFVWYQGEDDTRNSHLYYKLLNLLIKQWREDLGETVPVYIIQLPICQDRPENNWAEVRNAQKQVSEEIEEGFLVTSLDCGIVDDIHPTEKSVLGKRIGEIIQGTYYKNSPIAKVQTWDEHEIIIEIEQSKQIQIVGDCSIQSDHTIDDVFIEENLLIIRSQDKINYLEYGWSNAPQVSLFNEVGYPVSPFKFKK